MKIQIWAIGKPHDKELKSAIDDFTERCNNYFQVEWNIIPVPKNAGMMSEMDLKKKEGELIMQWMDAADFVVALDERGKEFNSISLSKFIQTKANASIKRLVFVIGGAFGLDEAILKRANHRWSLSQLTFPHQLARLILAEQLYRAFTILKNEKYHHS
jgi:23S rRNA (pseudouridine1915-N3)-methyltransferase